MRRWPVSSCLPSTVIFTSASTVEIVCQAARFDRVAQPGGPSPTAHEQQQRQLARAIENAREMALPPYGSR
ncbi:hypothetical protein [Streptomyces iranensis]|uniref:hypothetical protein n=1 Tax=Streptomyces iranensis TaxID=576784 RepID=UPI00247A2F28|nr:hypothetical protein [Streptomyces iranensis]